MSTTSETADSPNDPPRRRPVRRAAYATVPLVISVALIYFLAPGLKDRILYSGVDEGCSERLVLGGDVWGRHCHSSMVYTSGPGYGRVAGRFGGGGQVQIYATRRIRRGETTEVQRALLRTPGDEGVWYCANGGTITVDDQFDVELELHRVDALSIGDEGTMRVRPTGFQHEISHGQALGSLEAEATVSGHGGRPFTLTLGGGARTWSVALRPDPTSEAGPVEEATVYFDDGERTTVLHRRGPAAGQARWADDRAALELRGGTFGPCGGGNGTGTITVSWD